VKRRKKKRVVKVKEERTCWFCGSSKGLEKHHIIPKEIGGSGLEDNKVYICKKCHSQLHKLLTPVINHLVTYIYALQTELKKYMKVKEPHRVGFIWENGKKGGKKK